jgi:hypothetical protein
VKHYASVLTVSMAVAGTASAQIVVDGTVDAAYGPALSIQNTNTGFGDTADLDGDDRTSGGSEIDGVYGTVSGGFLNLFIAGNMESNFNKLEIFIDSESGVGMNVLDGLLLPEAVDAFCCGGFGTTDGALQRMSGMTFDAGFAADYYMTIANGTESTGGALGVSGWIATAHFAELNNGTIGANVRVGGVLDPYGDELDASLVSRGLPLGTVIDQNNNLFGGVGDIALHEFFEPLDLLGDPTNDLNHRDMENTLGILMGVNNGNEYTDDGELIPTVLTGGVIGNGDTEIAGPAFEALAAGVTTGFEVAIPLAAIGNPTGDILVTAFVNGSGHDYASNQFSGTGILAGNPGGDNAGGFTGTLSGVDLTAFAGDQFVTITQGLLDGDLNADGFVGIADLNIVLGVWNTNVTPGDLLAGDPSGDGFVGIADLNVVLGNWNAGTPPAASVVPEPTTLALLGLGGIAMLKRRR